MTSKSFPRLRRLCNTLPKTSYDRDFESLSALQQLLTVVATAVVVLTIPPLLVESPEAESTVGVSLAVGVLYSLANLLARYNRR
ncbi:hypothetical protein M0R88_02540 [Halorussus gelatinilyticus]|uniref:Uncharacterized protein n=1 Tax=Halorussus gelatinilyticus TaxID=2937524 RepID=A0A8U0IIR5_9EURY|nr:hypothetical protein [Halorussus gelatinilyticus]UPW00987.1 hypothetical protein M0R88_02540 [Halorussus gelatinilyticus]